MNLAHDTGTMMPKHFSSSRGEELIEVDEIALGKVLGETVETEPGGPENSPCQ